MTRYWSTIHASNMIEAALILKEELKTAGLELTKECKVQVVVRPHVSTSNQVVSFSFEFDVNIPAGHPNLDKVSFMEM